MIFIWQTALSIQEGKSMSKKLRLIHDMTINGKKVRKGTIFKPYKDGYIGAGMILGKELREHLTEK